MPIKSVKIKISKYKKCAFSHIPRITQPKNRFLGQKMCPVARSQTDRVTTEGTLSGFQEFFLQPIIKDRPNIDIRST